MKTVKVRIAVAVADNGQWCSCGWLDSNGTPSDGETISYALDGATAAKGFMAAADTEPASDERLIRATVAYRMLVQRSMISAAQADIDRSHAIAIIASNFDDDVPDTPERADLFTVRLGEVG